MKIKTLNRDMIESMIGYRPFTTFFEDFSIADHFGQAAIKDTYRRCFESWKHDYKYLTELVMILNWKIWEHYPDNEKLAILYNELWETTSCFCYENLEGDELRYYIGTTD